MISLSLIVLIPFLSSFILAFTYLFSSSEDNKESFYSTFGVLAPLISAILSFIVAGELFSMDSNLYLQYTLFNWITIGDLNINLAFMADRLTAVMLLFITSIGTLIHIYAVGYMHKDEGYGKFFSYFNLFIGSMLLLVLADNPIIMFVGWELVGLSSYLLISFYHKDRENVKAGNKAFILNRVGDFGFIMGISLLFISLGDSGFTFEAIENNILLIDNQTLTVIGLLLFVGAMGKSAQIPLFVWLPDAMAGPTPVSALIHAATMVTAGVYMVARFSFIYNEVPDVGEFIAIIGASSALFASIIASFQTDIKKILAYSTMSQLGYMFIAVGLGAYSSGIFHVFTHAFFKALLFMGAGAVIIALHHEQNIFKMGGLKKDLGVVFVTMFIATLAISGIPPFAGFFSKDAIILTAFASEHYIIWAMATVTAFLTAYYMFRLIFVVFYAPAKESKRLEPLSFSMTMPLVILAIGSATVGFLGVPEAYGGENIFSSFISLPDKTYHLTHQTEYILGAINIFGALVAIFISYKLFANGSEEGVKEAKIWKKIIFNKFYIDEVYDIIFVKSLLSISHFLNHIIDNKIINGSINLIVYGYLKSANLFSLLQNGKVRYYSLHILVGMSLVSIALLILLGGL
ncbi:NADH-ubiquinone oxidoreductase chain L [hydrothermal vent metagenome]|uniref:NADH-ubiquinone oxidoreductase chain L n=1 Tax=hydrothermal vent metagenome TaxID=652676 RepID=A0A1W1C0H9_9ZZZZ